MSLIAQGKTYTPAPEGVHAAVCVDVVDKGWVETEWGGKHKCRIVWELSLKMDDGRPFTIGKTYSVSLHEKATLYKDLKAWRGKAFTADELRGFDIERVLGAPCQLVVTHEERDGVVYGNVTALMKADPKNILKPTGKYIRAKDREGYQTPPSAPLADDPPQTKEEQQAEIEESIPF